MVSYNIYAEMGCVDRKLSGWWEWRRRSRERRPPAVSIVLGPHRPTGLRLYEATTRNSPPTDQSVGYSCFRLCKKQGLPFLACFRFFCVLPHHRVCRTHKQMPKVSSTNPRLSDSDRRGWYLIPLVFLRGAASLNKGTSAAPRTAAALEALSLSQNAEKA